MKKTEIINQEDLMRRFEHNKETGIFTWKIKPNSMVNIGDIAGHKSKSVGGYIVIKINSISHLAHRLAWLYEYGKAAEFGIDHINGIRSDNRICNLRLANQEVNSKNQKVRVTNKSGIMGVQWLERLSKWQVRAQVCGVEKYFGVYSDFFEACCVRKKVELDNKYHKNHGRSL